MPRRGLRRDVGRVGLLFTSVGSIIGSGWLLGALNATQFAGPAAIIAWVVAAAAIILLALIHAELGSMFPMAGGVARFPHFAFGRLVGFGGSWTYWLGSVTLPPIETEAALQYMTKYVHDAFGITLVHKVGKTPVLNGPGYIVAAVLMLGFVVLNLYGVRLMSRFNTALVWWKIAVPVLTFIVLIVVAFDAGNFSAGDGFAPAGVKGILQAMAAGGVIFSYLGFEQAIQFGGETQNPRRNIPFAVIGSIAIGTVVYVFLQLSFVGAINTPDVAKGWANLNFTNDFGPYAGVATTLGLGWLAVLLYIDAFISPTGTGLIYTGSSSRITYAMGRQGYIPSAFDKLSERGIPVFSLAFTYLVGLVLFLPFPGWQKLVGFVSSAVVLIFALQCLALPALRRALPDHDRPYRLPAAEILAPVGFAVANLIVLFAGWTTDWKLFVGLLIGFAVLALYTVLGPGDTRRRLDLRSAAWYFPWLAGLALIIYLSSFDGQKVLPLGWDLLATVVWSAVIYVAALRVPLFRDQVCAYVEEAAAEAAEESEAVVTAA
jgi:amino acid transporter